MWYLVFPGKRNLCCAAANLEERHILGAARNAKRQSSSDAGHLILHLQNPSKQERINIDQLIVPLFLNHCIEGAVCGSHQRSVFNSTIEL